MNVLMVVSWYTPKGSEKLEAGVFHYEQSCNLQQHCNVAIYYPFDTEIDCDETKDIEWGLLTYRSRYKVGKIHDTKRRVNSTMAKILEEFKPDIIHAHCGGAAGYYVSNFCNKKDIPLIITEHSPLELTKVDRFGIGRIFTNKAYKTSKMNVCVSRDSMNKLSAIFPKYPFQVIFNGIVLPEYQATQKKYYKEGYINVVIVAVLYDLEIKGLKYLLEAIADLKKNGYKFALHHIGGGEYLDHFKDLAHSLDIEEVVTFYGKCTRSELYEISSEMDFFCSASLFECSGVSVQEAMLLGKPILGTNSGGVDSLVPPEAGHIVQKGNSQSLVDGMLYMKDHLNDYDNNWIKEYAFKSFEINHISTRYMDLYNRILTERR